MLGGLVDLSIEEFRSDPPKLSIDEVERDRRDWAGLGLGLGERLGGEKLGADRLGPGDGLRVDGVERSRMTGGLVDGELLRDGLKRF